MDAWREKVDQWGATTYEHPDGSEVCQIWGHKWFLCLGDPPAVFDEYATVEAAKAGHAEEMADRAEAADLKRRLLAWTETSRGEDIFGTGREMFRRR